jgi:formamidopyrimidine-DNA glycosylase
MSSGAAVTFNDPRRFGLMTLLTPAQLARHPVLSRLGPEPLSPDFDAAALARACRGRKTALKVALLDQRVVAGIGNIYASEILHRTGVHPARKAGSIREPEWSAIAVETRLVLEEAIDRMGTTFSSYRTLWNEPGQYGERLLVYDRAGQPCRRCGRPIRRSVIGQRSTYFCPSCQPARGSGNGKK